MYRIVVIEDSNKREGKTIEDIGTYNPHVEPLDVKCKSERLKYWISVGAQPTNTVLRILSSQGLLEYTPRTSSQQKVSKKERNAD